MWNVEAFVPDILLGIGIPIYVCTCRGINQKEAARLTFLSLQWVFAVVPLNRFSPKDMFLTLSFPFGVP